MEIDVDLRFPSERPAKGKFYTIEGYCKEVEEYHLTEVSQKMWDYLVKKRDIKRWFYKADIKIKGNDPPICRCENGFYADPHTGKPYKCDCKRGKV
jgi:hypothetical protein